MTIQTMARAVASGDMYRTYAQQLDAGYIKPYAQSVAKMTYPEALANQKVYTYRDGIQAHKIQTYQQAVNSR